MEYKTPLFAIIVLVIMILWVVDFWRLFRKPQIYIPSKYVKKKSVILRGIVFSLGIAAWLYIGFSAMGPRKPLSFTKNTIEVNDLFFVIDVSRSMLANDFPPNRLEVAKEKLREFIKLRPTDRIGIIIFSEKVFTLLPLTTDLKLITQIIDEIKIGFLGGGTNIGDALGLAVARGAQSLAKNKVIILLTDGVSNYGSITPKQAAEQAKENKMKVYTIGIGSSKDAKIPVGNTPFGVQYGTIPGGSIDTKTLEMVSSMTGGKSYLAENAKALKDILSEIGNLEKTEIESSSRIVYEELYYKYLLLGVCLLLITELTRRVVLREVL